MPKQEKEPFCGFPRIRINLCKKPLLYCNVLLYSYIKHLTSVKYPFFNYTNTKKLHFEQYLVLIMSI